MGYTRNNICNCLFWTKVAVAMSLSVGGLLFLVWRVVDLHSHAIYPSTSVSILPPVTIVDPATGQVNKKCYYDTTSQYARLEPQSNQMMLGFSLDWSYDTPQKIVKKLNGYSPVVYNAFLDLAPGTFNGQGYNSEMLDWHAQEAGRVGGILELSLQPNASLRTFTNDMYEKVATQLLEVNTKYGVPVYLRYGHEMNGDWNFYTNQPTAYKASFRAMAAAVRAKTNMTAMVWAPNVGITYPFTGGSYTETPKPGGVDFDVLDTNHDGTIDNYDDPYTPFYPGDDVVDWVGISLYNYPFPGCFNCAVEPTYFNDYLTGKGPVAEKGAAVTPAYTAVHDFYQMFCTKETHNKPLMIPETGSPWHIEYVNMAGAQSEIVVKSGWWNQLFSSSTMSKFPKMKLVVNFEETKPGWPLGTEVTQNWKVTNTTSQLTMFTGLLNTYLPNLVQSKELKYSCDGTVVHV